MTDLTNINQVMTKQQQYEEIFAYLKGCFDNSDEEINQHIATTFPDLSGYAKGKVQ